LLHEQGRAVGMSDAGEGVSMTDGRDRDEAGPGGSARGVREKRGSGTGCRWGTDMQARVTQCRAARFEPDLKQNPNSNGSNNFKLFQTVVN
jgi:hypothetical protein